MRSLIIYITKMAFSRQTSDDSMLSLHARRTACTRSSRCWTTPRSLLEFGGVILFLLGLSENVLAGWDYGNGRHGNYVLTTNSTIEQLYQAVRLSTDPPQYNPQDTNAIPNFQRLTISNGARLTANPWNGSAGGWIVFKVESSLTVDGGAAIFATGIGYRGGIPSVSDRFPAGVQGESYSGNPMPNREANFGGGGGGITYDIHNTGGGDRGSYSAAGGGGYAERGDSIEHSFFGLLSAGGGTYGTANLETVYLGSGGGAYPIGPNNSGGDGGNGPNGGNGGTGGGIIAVDAGSIQTEGEIIASGSPGSGGGGGGSGGSIRLRVTHAMIGLNTIRAEGGSGNGGGKGGAGRIALYYASSYTGTTIPSPHVELDEESHNFTIITNPPHAQTTLLGAGFKFNVGCYGLSPLAFQWNFNGRAILGETNQTFIRTQAALSDEGEYTVTISNPVMTIVSSNAYLKVLDTNAPLSDGIPNWWKLQFGLPVNDASLAVRHPPGDTLTYYQKFLYRLNPEVADTDADGLSDYNELFLYGTNPSKESSSGDGVPDGWKLANGVNPLVSNADEEVGTTGTTYGQLYRYSTNLANSVVIDPRNPFSVPGMPATSVFEVLNGGQHTNRFYYDKKDRLKGAEYSKGIAISYQYDGNGNLTNQSVLSRASETNGLPVLWLQQHALPNHTGVPYEDADGDGWSNYQEWKAGTDPTDSNSGPNPTLNPGESIWLEQWLFAPNTFVVGTGQLDEFGAEEIAVSADGYPGSQTNFLVILTQEPFGWSSQRIDVGHFGVTSVAIGRPANRINPAVYLGLRGNPFGQVVEFVKSGGVWQSNILATSANDTAYVLGIRPGAELLASFSREDVDSGLFALSFANESWNQTILSTNRGADLPGTHGTVWSRTFRDASVRILRDGQLEVVAGDREAVKNNKLLTPNWAYNSVTSKFYFQSTNAMSRDDGEALAQQYGTHLATISDLDENRWVANQFAKPYWIGLYMENRGGSLGQIYGAWSSSGPVGASNIPYSQWSAYWDPDFNPFYYFEGGGPYPWPNGVCVGMRGDDKWTCKAPGNQFRSLIEATDVRTFSNRWVISTTSPSRLTWRANQFATARMNSMTTNETSLVACFVEDRDGSGSITASDEFVLTEYKISGDDVIVSATTNITLGSATLNHNFGLVALDYLKSGSGCIMTFEPTGKIFVSLRNDGNKSLNRTLFCDAYAGSAWNAMAGVKMAEGGEGLIGLRSIGQNDRKAEVVFWPPQPTLPQIVDLPHSPPIVRLLPATDSGGNSPTVPLRIWDAEGNRVRVDLEFNAGLDNWRRATLSSPNSFDARPDGINGALQWNALQDLHQSFDGNVQIRVRASDSETGAWSEASLFHITTTTPPPEVSVTTEISGNRIVLNWTNPASFTATLESSATIGVDANWEPVPDFQAGSNSYSIVPDLSESTRFFRLRIQ